MLTIEETCFARSIPEPQLLLKYGFTADDGKYEYSRKFMDDLFLARIIISFGKKKDFVIKGQIIDLDNDEEYLPVRSSGGGSFTCKVRNEYIKLLEDIRSRCFRSNYYSLEQANLITAYIEGELGKKIEFPWLKAPDAGIFRCANNKMFALIMQVDYSKLDPKKKDPVEIINLKVNPKDIPLLIQKKGFYPAYHMNKTNWISIVLDGTVNIDTIRRFIDKSFATVDKLKKSSSSGQDYTLANGNWIVICNTSRYNVFDAFKKSSQILWKQSNNIKPGDTAFIYVGAPYSSIMFKCRVDEVNIPYDHKWVYNAMKITLLNRYRHGQLSNKVMAKFGITSVRGPRRMTEELLEHIRKNCEDS